MLYCEAELCLAASTFARGGILSENFKDGKVAVHSAKNTTKFDAIVGRSANHADQVNLGVAAALRSNIYGGVQRATSLTTTVSGGPDADDCAYVEFKVDGSQSALSNSLPYLGMTIGKSSLRVDAHGDNLARVETTGGYWRWAHDG